METTTQVALKGVEHYGDHRLESVPAFGAGGHLRVLCPATGEFCHVDGRNPTSCLAWFRGRSWGLSESDPSVVGVVRA